MPSILLHAARRAHQVAEELHEPLPSRHPPPSSLHPQTPHLTAFLAPAEERPGEETEGEVAAAEAADAAHRREGAACIGGNGAEGAMFDALAAAEDAYGAAHPGEATGGVETGVRVR